MAIRKRPANGVDKLEAKLAEDIKNGVELTPEQQRSVEEAATKGTRRRRGQVKSVIGMPGLDPNRRVIDERGRMKRTLTWEKKGAGWVAVETRAELVQTKQRDGKVKWTAKLWGSDAGRFATLSGAKAFAVDAFNLDPEAMETPNGEDPAETARELVEALANLGDKGGVPQEELDEVNGNIIELDKQRDAAVNRAKERLTRLNAAKTAKARHEAAEAAAGRKVPVTEADVEAVRNNLADQRAGQRRAAQEITKKARAAKRAAERGSTPRTPSEGRFNACPLCGFEFSSPKARCSSTAACEKRQAERKSEAKAEAKPTKKAPAKKADAPTKKAPAKATPAKKGAAKKK